jgi:hypothetical protein
MKKLMIVSLVAAAGLTVVACKGQEAAVDANAVTMNETVANEATNDTMGDVNAVAGATAGAANAVVAGAANAVK